MKFSLHDSRVRHLAKSFTWRIIATLTTFTLSYLFFKDTEGALEKATWIAVCEFFLKMFIYYGHERAWYRLDLGLAYRKRKNQQEAKIKEQASTNPS